jgi:hypothetical protein
MLGHGPVRRLRLGNLACSIVKLLIKYLQPRHTPYLGP